MELPRLTQFSPGAGCGCKISPMQLQEILATTSHTVHHPSLLVGNEKNDDAAVMDIGNGICAISTTDFFTPIVDDPFDYGMIAATNALSDIYAMGGNPIMAIAVLGWPLQKLPAQVASEVVKGAREVCANAGIPLAGGHSIDISDPVFGLAVTGLVARENIKMNSTAHSGDVLYLTKPIGIGIITTAEKKNLVQADHRNMALKYMKQLNMAGAFLGKQGYVTAMTDVTGFGLAGHLLEMCEGSGTSAKLYFEAIPLLPGIQEYLEQAAIPGGTYRNFKSYGNKLQLTGEIQKLILCDPQTSGGLLVSIDPGKIQEFELLCNQNSIEIHRVGEIIEKQPNQQILVH